jgi:protein-S-isoprenylcysteine O-methyltransferase Ste14
MMQTPYRYLRHPIYAAVLWFTWTGALSHVSASNAGLAVLGTVGAAIRIMAEERFLRLQYPEYAAYAARTKRVVPFIL